MAGLADWMRARFAALDEAVPQPARNSLLAYARAMTPDFMTPPHIADAAAHLEAVERGEIKRLMIVMPPRFGKSFLAQHFVPWYLGRSPNRHVMHVSYASKLVLDWGYDIRSRMLDPAHTAIFPDSALVRQKRAVDDFRTVSGGKYFAAGVGGGLTGRGATLLLVDDVYKNAEEADSESYREKVRKWYDTSARTRLQGRGGGAIVAIGTRWHHADLLSHLMRQEVGWRVVHYTPFNEDGESVWPELFPTAELHETRGEIDPRTWQCMFMGKPSPDEGLYFEKHWFAEDSPPAREDMAVYIASDYAVSDEAGADFTAHMVVGIDRLARLFVLDVWRRRARSDQWVSPLVDMIERWKPHVCLTEGGPIEKAVGPLLDRELRRRSIATRRVVVPSVVGKAARARAIQSWIGLNRLWLPLNAYWADDLKREMLEFPTGQHDDQVDCLSLVGRAVNLREARLSKPAPPGPRMPTMDSLMREAGLQ